MMLQELWWVLKAKAGDMVSGFKQGESQAKQSSGGIVNSMKWLQRGIQTAIASAAVVFVKKVHDMGLAMAEMASGSMAARRQLDYLAAAAGQTGTKMAASIQAGMSGTVSGMKSVEMANRALVAGLNASEQQMGDLAFIAKELSGIVGKEAPQAFDDLVRAISKGELGDVGVMLGGAKSVEILEGLGKGASSAAKRVALLNEVIRLGKARVEEMGGAADTLTDAINRNKARLEDQREMLGAKLLPLYEKWIEIVGRAADVLMKFFNIEPIRSGEDAMRHRLLEISAVIAEINRQAADPSNESALMQRAHAGAINKLLKEQLEIQNKLAALEKTRTETSTAAIAAQEASRAQQARIDSIKMSPAETAKMLARDLPPQIRFGSRDRWDSESGKFVREDKGMEAAFDFKHLIPPKAIDTSTQKVKESAAEMRAAMLEVPQDFESATREAYIRIADATAALGIRIRGIMSGAWQVKSGLEGLGAGDALANNPTLNRLIERLNVLGSYGQVVAGVLGVMSGIRSAIGMLGTKIEGVDRASNDELRRIANGEALSGAAAGTPSGRALQAAAREELDRRMTEQQQRGDITSSTVITMTEATGKQMAGGINSLVALAREEIEIHRDIRGLLRDGITVRGATTAESLANDTQARRRASGLET